MSKLSDQISVRFSPETREALAEIGERHGIAPTVFIRRMVEAGVRLYHVQGNFSFPVKVVPDLSPPSPKSG
jgi:predicted DNA-binding protein